MGLADGTELHADGVVLAADIAGLQRIVENSPGVGDDDWRKSVAKLGTAPPFIVHRLWLDKQSGSQTERRSSEPVAGRRWTM